MILRILKRSFYQRYKRVLLVLLSVAMGSSLVAILFTVALQISERIGKELRAYGANIVLMPKRGPLEVVMDGINLTPPELRAHLEEASLERVKKIFWRHNITAFTPLLSGSVTMEEGGEAAQAVLTGSWFHHRLQTADGEEFITGAERIFPWWKVGGVWPREGNGQKGILAGTEIAEGMGLRVGDRLKVKQGGREEEVVVVGTFESGGAEDWQLFSDLATVQDLFHLPGKVDQVLVSALTKPDDALARRDPQGMPAELYDIWYCSPYLSSIMYQLEEALPKAQARSIGRIVEAEQSFLRKMQLLLTGATLVALVAAALGVLTTITTDLSERRCEVALMKAIGASAGQIARLFFIEQGLLGFAGGCLGYLVGTLFFHLGGGGVVSGSPSLHPLSFPLTLLAGVTLALLGAVLPVRQAVRSELAPILKEAV